MNVLTRVAIIRCPRAHHRAIWSAVSTITNIEKIPCAINMLHVGGITFDIPIVLRAFHTMLVYITKVLSSLARSF